MINSFNAVCDALHKERMQLLDERSTDELRVVLSPRTYHEWLDVHGIVSPVMYELRTKGTMLDCGVDVARPAITDPRHVPWRIVKVLS